MGQLITVTRKPSIRPDVAIFELNRSLTGMGHERYRSAAEAVRDRPVDELRDDDRDHDRRNRGYAVAVIGPE